MNCPFSQAASIATKEAKASDPKMQARATVFMGVRDANEPYFD
jgi:hypothetical protein